MDYQYQQDLTNHLDALINIGIEHQEDLVAVLGGALAAMLLMQIATGDMKEIYRLKNFLLKWDAPDPTKRTYTFVGEIKN